VSGPSLPDGIVFDASGLVPVVAQDHLGGELLMVAWANQAALERTAATGQAHFWSRSRSALWRKGETSGNVLRVRAIRRDCDGDALLYLVDAAGPACHTGARSCFGAHGPQASVLAELERLVADRDRARPEGSYTTKLFARGLDASLKKVGEEATEVILAAKGESAERLAEEAADLLFHLLVALRQRNVPLGAVLAVLAERRARVSEK